MNANDAPKPTVDPSPIPTERFFIGEIPALFWGPESEKIVVAAHGAASSKSDVPFEILAQETAPRGFRTLTFDLPEHGERRGTATRLEPRTCVDEFRKIVDFARRRATVVDFAGVSLGAYFGLLAFDGDRGKALRRAFFLSPVLSLERLIEKTARSFDVSFERLEAEREIALPDGRTLSWDYYRFVRENPIRNWRVPTAILRGARDELCEKDVDEAFAKKFSVRIETAKNSAHYFYTDDDLRVFRGWIRREFNFD